jgi:rod shape-determining protein MreD
MSTLVKNIIRFCLFILVQVFVLNQIPPLHHLVTPYLYFLFILWLPFKMGRRTQLILAFALGFVLDSFTKTYGLHMAPCLLIAYLRPFLINILITQEGAETNYSEPSAISMGVAPYFTYITVLTFIHHTLLFFLQALQTGGYFYFLVKSLLSTAISLLLILLTELLFVRKKRFRTNNI